MAFCPNCGAQILTGAKFCQNCGIQISAAVYNTTQLYNTVASPVYSSVDTSRNDYRIIMIRRDTCTKTNARELLMDIFGYTTAESNTILDSLPAEIACNLTFQQAVYASQALTEYGIDVSVTNSDGYTDINQYASSTVYDNNGSFLSSVLSVLGTLTVANRINKLSRWDRPVAYTFRPTYRRSAPPVYTRHYIRKPALAVKRMHTPVPRRDEPLRNAISPVKSSRSSSSNSKVNTPISRGLHPDPHGGKKGGGNNGPLGPGPSGPLGPDRRR